METLSLSIYKRLILIQGTSFLMCSFWLEFEQDFRRDCDQGFTHGDIPSYGRPKFSVSRWANEITRNVVRQLVITNCNSLIYYKLRQLVVTKV